MHGKEQLRRIEALCSCASVCAEVLLEAQILHTCTSIYHLAVFLGITAVCNLPQVTDEVNKLALGQPNNEMLNSKDAQIIDVGQTRP